MSKSVASAANPEVDMAPRYPTDSFSPPSLRYGAASLYGATGGRKYLNRQERERALAAMRGLEPGKALYALTLAWTGGRVSEVLALAPLSFQIERGVVALRTLKRRRHVVREVPIPPVIMQQLDAHFRLIDAQREPARASARLWTFRRETAWRLIKKVMATANVSGSPACPRGLRHAFGVGALQAGIPLNLAQRWLGHARISTTAIYADVAGPEEIMFAARFWANDNAALRPPGHEPRRA
jgi:integrase